MTGIGTGRQRVALATVLAMVGLLLTIGLAGAHERRTVGSYQLIVGFLNEPAVAEEPNALSLTVQTGQGNDAKPVEGLANSLKAEVKFGGQTMPLALTARFGQPGAYAASFIPTAEGAYTFHITGSIEGTNVDESFTSGPNTFAEVASRSTMTFPAKVPPVREVSAAAQSARDTADTARMLGIAGLVAGVLGLVVGAAGFVAARNARASTAPVAASVERQREAGGPAGS
jgi:hypothetical protein